ncbi:MULTISPECIES: Hemin transport protein [Xanthomonas]|uniref:Hemin transport protein n=1 Tax=Xanthomonas cucurbitae TaxID=56453 RepID=A0A2S7DUN4_9XANT|nr:Hemin transport protein [Xanthomonas cucurbitae]PPU77534.1 Hemin transport protein [Xanthomonas cucurbitae]QHG86128.1 Hemin transport protein [Xanthomonas cucurbitae]WDM68373.1 Hemin transport protein [Xanthomonas cucurbitae]WDM72247.1 Hemin transport protein [Xanthomonas cucurbitae]WDM76042.1 Hemin transport protein [Xanthomonas cucurbitae]
MSIARPSSLSPSARATGSTLPRPAQLAALGTVLCLYRPALGNELDGWQHAIEAATCRQLDSDGVREGICFFDADGQCCWRLYLLPDSDFLNWDRLVSRLPALSIEPQGLGVGERLWRRLAGRMRGESWRLSALRLRAASDRTPSLAASLATVSALGADVAARLAHAEGIDARVVVDDCCCARAAALRAASPATAGSDPAAMTSALLRLPR